MTAKTQENDWLGPLLKVIGTLLYFIIFGAFILCQGEWIRVEHLPKTVLAAAESQKPRHEGSSITALEVDAIRSALDRHNGNRTRAAAELGIHRTTLLRKLRKFEMK